MQTTTASCAASKDIATQLVDALLDTNVVDIALGGGRQNFLPVGVAGDDHAGGSRRDGIDLIARVTENGGDYVGTRAGLDALIADSRHWGTRPVLGLFEPSHLDYEYDRRNTDIHATADDPALWELTKAAIDYLEKASGDEGYYLMIEGGRVDHSNHDGSLFRAVTDGVAYQEAIQYAADRTSEEDTLIISTADHSHALEFNGYCGRGSPVNGLCYEVDPVGEVHLDQVNLADDDRPFTVASYLNGGGSVLGERSPNRLDALGRRKRITQEMATSPDYHQESLIPSGSESHSPMDVGIYARGPWSHLFSGTMEQHQIYHIMRYAVTHGTPLPCDGGVRAIADGKCDCDGHTLDACGVCGGSGIQAGACDCVGHVMDMCGVCGGFGVDTCGVCNGPGIRPGECSCGGNVFDRCGVCGGVGDSCAEQLSLLVSTHAIPIAACVPGVLLRDCLRWQGLVGGGAAAAGGSALVPFILGLMLGAIGMLVGVKCGGKDKCCGGERGYRQAGADAEADSKLMMSRDSTAEGDNTPPRP